MKRENQLRRRLERDEPVFGASAATFSPAVVETFGAIGLDFVWLDFEHGGPSPYDSTVFEGLTRAAEAADIELFVRLPSGDPPLVRKVLDAGVRTILIPRVETAAEVREAVSAARFSIDGDPADRGIGVGRGSTWGADFDDHAAREDAETLVGVMIENETAIDNIEEILAVPELGFAFIGPADLSVSVGHPMEKEHPDVRTLVDRAESAVRKSDVALAGIHNDPQAIDNAIDDGYRVLRIGGEISAARQVLGERLASLER
ncbi:HpcH/HpaI aldolase family protein [Haloprofundus salinisoli]|uniref:HpcH/HpaI aldolase family protein n=1 Tax=Haloprofundus salinisoli TaxID=2876193 RepID=UPI001CCD07D5|nr:aldolase/citrate lyase family protein [Haloprofundus salinisoli]